MPSARRDQSAGLIATVINVDSDAIEARFVRAIRDMLARPDFLLPLAAAAGLAAMAGAVACVLSSRRSA